MPSSGCWNPWGSKSWHAQVFWPFTVNRNKAYALDGFRPMIEFLIDARNKIGQYVDRLTGTILGSVGRKCWMKKLNILLLSLGIIFGFNSNAVGFCGCKQPAYKDQIDFLLSYTACLEQCYNSQFEDFRSQIDISTKRIKDLESKIDLLNLRIKELEDQLNIVKQNN